MGTSYNKKFQSTAGSVVFFQRSLFYQSSVCLQSSSYICQRPLNLALVRQAKLVASFRVKVPDGRSPRIGISYGLTNHPYRVLRIWRSVASGFDC